MVSFIPNIPSWCGVINLRNIVILVAFCTDQGTCVTRGLVKYVMKYISSFGLGRCRPIGATRFLCAHWPNSTPGNSGQVILIFYYFVWIRLICTSGRFLVVLASFLVVHFIISITCTTLVRRGHERRVYLRCSRLSFVLFCFFFSSFSFGFVSICGVLIA